MLLDLVNYAISEGQQSLNGLIQHLYLAFSFFYDALGSLVSMRGETEYVGAEWSIELAGSRSFVESTCEARSTGMQFHLLVSF